MEKLWKTSENAVFASNFPCGFLKNFFLKRFFQVFHNGKTCVKNFSFPFFNKNYARWKRFLKNRAVLATLWKYFPLFIHTFSTSFSMTFQGPMRSQPPFFRDASRFYTVSPPPNTTTTKLLNHSFLFWRPLRGRKRSALKKENGKEFL